VLLRANYELATAREQITAAATEQQEEEPNGTRLTVSRNRQPWTELDCTHFEDGLKKFGGKHFRLIRDQLVIIIFWILNLVLNFMF
jgi:hypothetical protein